MKQEKENKTKEESLSKKRNEAYGVYNYPEDDVKEAVRKLKEEIGIMRKMISEEKQNRCLEIVEGKINKIFGAKLI